MLSPEQGFATAAFVGRFHARAQRIGGIVSWAAFSSVVVLLIVLSIRYAENSAVKTVLAIGAVLTPIGFLADFAEARSSLDRAAGEKAFGYRFSTSVLNSKK